MNDMPKFDRRTFVVGALAGGFSLGFSVPRAQAQTAMNAPGAPVHTATPTPTAMRNRATKSPHF